VVHAGGQCANALRVAVAFGPDGDRLAHRTDMPEQSKQHNDAGNVGRIVAACEEALAGGLHVDRIALQGETRSPIAERKCETEYCAK
jgi:hypothetical protein